MQKKSINKMCDQALIEISRWSIWKSQYAGRKSKN